MNNRINIVKNNILKQKRFYIFLLTLIIIGIISGMLFIFILTKADKSLVINRMSDFFNNIKTSKNINYSTSLINSLLVNTLSISIIWILGLSIIGFPIILIFLFGKSFIVGFSISSIISTYGIKGILGSFIYIFPHQILSLLLYLLLSFYSLSFCTKLFSCLFLKKTINFRSVMKKYLKILIISLVISIFITFYEVYLSTYFMKFFTLLLK